MNIAAVSRHRAPSDHSLSGKKRITAFTLAELLVCMAIIGVLAALIFPIIGSVKGGALRAQCSSNLRQCGTGINLYAAEHRGMAPSVTWTLEIQPYISAFAVKNTSSVTSAFPVSCPSLPYDDSAYGRSTYSMNSWLDTDHSNQNTDPATGKISYAWSMPLRNVEAPARKIMLFDGRLASTSPTGSQWAFNAVKGVEYIDFRHNGETANVLFVDGHVSALKRDDIHDGMWDWQGGGGD